RAQLICLPAYLRGERLLAEELAYDWAALSRACHQHPYELPPTFEELSQWMTTVERFVRHVADLARQDADRRKPRAN
ncbi:MAG: hypothetical protein AB7L71_20095, partial [Vicinamibacterales bacterium]